jgi:16S rRNA (guanine966-N2)-methyltransferase
MRITGGEARGRRLVTPRGLDIRPTSDRVREAIFSIIGQDLSGRQVLDLFAGTGSLGLEALSRGARSVLFIDHSPLSIRLIKKNLSRCGYMESGVVLKRDLIRGIPWHHPCLSGKIDLVFLDPPYASRLIPPIVGEIAESQRLTDEARLIVESSKMQTLPADVGGLRLTDSRIFGDTRISTYALRGKS